MNKTLLKNTPGVGPGAQREFESVAVQNKAISNKRKTKWTPHPLDFWSSQECHNQEKLLIKTKPSFRNRDNSEWSHPSAVAAASVQTMPTLEVFQKNIPKAQDEITNHAARRARNWQVSLGQVYMKTVSLPDEEVIITPSSNKERKRCLNHREFPTFEQELPSFDRKTVDEENLLEFNLADYLSMSNYIYDNLRVSNNTQKRRNAANKQRWRSDLHLWKEEQVLCESIVLTRSSPAKPEKIMADNSNCNVIAPTQEALPDADFTLVKKQKKERSESSSPATNGKTMKNAQKRNVVASTKEALPSASSKSSKKTVKTSKPLVDWSVIEAYPDKQKIYLWKKCTLFNESGSCPSYKTRLPKDYVLEELDSLPLWPRSLGEDKDRPSSINASGTVQTTQAELAFWKRVSEEIVEKKETKAKVVASKTNQTLEQPKVVERVLDEILEAPATAEDILINSLRDIIREISQINPAKAKERKLLTSLASEAIYLMDPVSKTTMQDEIEAESVLKSCGMSYNLLDDAVPVEARDLTFIQDEEALEYCVRKEQNNTDVAVEDIVPPPRFFNFVERVDELVPLLATSYDPEFAQIILTDVPEVDEPLEEVVVEAEGAQPELVVDSLVVEEGSLPPSMNEEDVLRDIQAQLSDIVWDEEPVRGIGLVEESVPFSLSGSWGSFSAKIKLRWEQMDDGELVDMAQKGYIFSHFILRNSVTAVTWGLFITLLGFFLPFIGIPLIMWTAFEWMGIRARSMAGKLREEILTPVVESTQAVMQEVDATINSAQRLVGELRGVEEDESISWRVITNSAQKHRIGLAACTYSASIAPDSVALALELAKATSMLGVEQSIVSQVIQRAGVFRSAQARVEQLEVPSMEGITSAVNDAREGLINGVATATKSSWDKKRLAGLAGLAVSMGGISLTGKSPLASITKASADARAIEEWWEKGEEYLNSVGLIHTGKWAYLKELADQVSALEEDLTYFNALFAATPSFICKSSIWNRWVKFRASVKEIDDTCKRNTCADLRNSKIFLNVQTIVTHVLKFDGMATQIRESNGVRPTPVGLCLFGPSQVGKSTLWAQIQKNIREKLNAKFVEDPEANAAFGDAAQWTCWNMQVRDDYDQGCDGQEMCYCDDAFAETDNEDHSKWLTFISTQAIGTVQAELQAKGRPFRCRVCAVSCNTLPTKSSKINNIDALWNRFPYTIQVVKKESVNVPSIDAPHDPTFAHLRLFCGKMGEWANAPTTTSRGTTQHRGSEFSGVEITLDELCDRMVNDIISAERKYEGMANLVTNTQTFTNNAVRDQTYAEVVEQFNPNIQHAQQAYDPNWNSEQDALAARLAYTVPPITSPLDPRLLAVLAHLELPINGVMMNAAVWAGTLDMDEQGVAMQPFLHFHRMVIINGHGDALNAALGNFINHAVRVRNSQLEEDYLWSPRWNDGKVLLLCPYIEGVVAAGELENTVDDQGNPVLLTVSFRGDAFAERNRNIMGVLNRANVIWTDDADPGFAEAARLARAIVFICYGAPWFVHGTLQPVPRTLASQFFARSRNAYLNATNTNHSAFERAAHAVFTPLAVVFDAIDYIITAAKYISNKVIDAVMWFFEFIGMPINATWEGLFRFISETGLIVAAGAILPIIAGFLWAFVKWIFSASKRMICGTPERDEEYQKQTQKKDTLKQTRVPKEARRVAEFNWVDITAPPMEGKVNYYEEKELPCPFCDEETIKAGHTHFQMSLESGSKYWCKANKQVKPGMDDCFVILPSEHSEENPLKNKKMFCEEFEALLQADEGIDDEVDTQRFIFERNYGAGSGGTVPHAHIQLHYKADLVDDAKPVEKVKVTAANRQTVVTGSGSRAAIVVRFRLPSSYEAIEQVFDKLQPLVEVTKLGSWLVQGQVVGSQMEMCFVLLSALHEDKTEVPFVKKATMMFEKHLQVLLGKIEEVPSTSAKEVLEGLPITKEQMDDRGSVTLLTRLVSENLCLIARYQSLGASSQGAILGFDDAIGPSCSALAFGDEVVFPAHCGEKNDLLKLWKQGHTTSAECLAKCRTDPYMVVKIIYRDPVRDFGYGRIITREAAEEYISNGWKIQVSLRHSMRVPPKFPSGLEKHLLTEKEAMAALEGVISLLYLPKRKITCATKATWAGTQKYRMAKDGDLKTREYIEVQGIKVEAGISDSGDCGGPLVIFNTRHVKKLLGFHVAGGYMVMNSCLMTTELLEVARTSCAAERFEQATNILSGGPVFDPPGLAGYGHQQLADWPKVDWADPDDDPFSKLVVPGVCVDAPVGPAVRDVGVFIGENQPANLAKGLRDWHRSPFFGAFDVAMAPGPLDPLDSRIEVDLPLNREGKPSLLLGPSSAMAEATPGVDMDILQECYDTLLEVRKTQFANHKVGLGEMSVDEIIDEGINGNVNNQFLTGMEVNSSSGLPWTNVRSMAKKSQLIDVDAKTGKRTFSRTGERLRLVLKRKLALARLGRRQTSFCVSKLKNTAIKKEHVAIGKTRVFNCSAIEDVISINALFGRMKDAFLVKRLDAQHAVGINVHSIEWDELFRHLAVFSHATDADYKNYDKRLMSLFMRVAYSIWIKVIAAVDPDGWDKARYVLAEADINSLMVDERSVYMTEHSNKSGGANTTPINCEVNLLMLMYCFAVVTGLPVPEFFRKVRLVSFGDDVVISIDGSIVDSFNFNSIQACLAKMGQIVTPGLKYEGEIPDTVPVEDLTFLKRSFQRVNTKMMAPLEQRSIESAFGWTDMDWNKDELVEGIILDHLNEAVLHGPEYYDYFCKSLLRRMKHRSFPEGLKLKVAPLLVRSFKDQQGIYFDKYGLRTEQMDTEFGQYIETNRMRVFEGLSSLGIVELGAGIKRLEGQMQQLGTLVDSLKTRVETNERKVEDLDNRVIGLSDRFDTLSDVFGELEERVDGFDERITSNTTELDALKQQVADHESTITYLEDKVDTQSKLIIAQTDAIQSLTRRLAAVEAVASSNTKRVVTLERTTGTFSANIAANKKAVDGVIRFIKTHGNASIMGIVSGTAGAFRFLTYDGENFAASVLSGGDAALQSRFGARQQAISDLAYSRSPAKLNNYECKHDY